MIRSEPRNPLSAPAELAAERDDAAAVSLFRVGLWGGTAAACLLAVALATRTETGQSRIAAALGTAHTQPEVVAQAPDIRDVEADARRMADTIRDLTEDRDRLLARMTALERNYEDVTGSIGRLTAGKPPAEPAPAPGAVPPPVIEPAPVVSAPAAAPAPAQVAAVPPPPEAVPVKTEFGVDIGGGPTLASLRNAWERIRRNHASLLDGLRPVIAVRDGRGGVDLRLIVGPIGNAAGAAKLCASLAAAGLSCQPTVFEGQRLAGR